jgi:hypothetical protein
MMISITKPPCQSTNAQHDQQFLELVPTIERHARSAFRNLQPQVLEEAISAVVFNAFCAFRRLVERGKQELAYASPLARFAVARYWSGRCAGMPSGRDVMSQQARAAHGFAVERLDRFDEKQGEWREVLVEDRCAGPAEIAAARIDVAAWLRSLPRRNRRIAKTLAMGETTSEVARQFRLSRPRVSQLREELKLSWQMFQGEAMQTMPTRQASQRGRVALVA